VVSRGLLPACYPVTPPHALAVMDIPYMPPAHGAIMS